MLYERLIKELKAHKQELIALILGETIEDFASYRYLIGKLKGVEDAIEILRETFKRGNDE